MSRFLDGYLMSSSEELKEAVAKAEQELLEVTRNAFMVDTAIANLFIEQEEESDIIALLQEMTSQEELEKLQEWVN
jgi:hypothetical protein